MFHEMFPVSMETEMFSVSIEKYGNDSAIYCENSVIFFLTKKKINSWILVDIGCLVYSIMKNDYDCDSPTISISVPYHNSFKNLLYDLIGNTK